MKMLKKIALAVVLILAAVIILPTGAENFLVKARLDAVVARLAEKDGTAFNYDSVSVKGFYPAKRIELTNPRITLKTPSGAVVYGFESAELRMESPLLNKWHLTLPSPISLVQNLQKLATVKTDTPIEGDVAILSLTEKSAEMSLAVPAKIAVLQELFPEKPAAITFSEKPVVALKLSEGKPDYIRVSVKQMIAQGPVDADRYELADGTFIYQKSPHPEKKVMQDVELVLDKLVVPYYVHPYGEGTLIFRTNILGEYAFTDDAAGNALQLMTRTGDIQISEASYNVKDFGINLKGDMKTDIGDMPNGTGQLVLRNVPFVLNEIIENNMLSADRRSLLYTIVSTMTGDSVSDLKDASIPITRAARGDLIIGGISLSVIREAIAKNDARIIKESSKKPD